MSDWECYACGTKETYHYKKGNKDYYLWYVNTKDTAICSNCYKKIWYHPTWDKRRITFMGKRIYLDEEPRKQKCEECGKEGYTHLHHEKYDLDDPLAHTKELCPSCHTKETHKMNQYKIPIKERPRGYRGRFLPTK